MKNYRTKTEYRLRRFLKLHPEVTLEEIYEGSGVSISSLKNVLEHGSYFNTKNKDRLDNFMRNYNLKENNITIPALTSDEIKCVSSLTIDSNYDKANAIALMLSRVGNGGDWHYLCNENKHSSVVSRLFEAIVLGEYVVEDEDLFCIKLSTGHYLSMYEYQGEKVLGYSVKFTDAVIRDTANNLRHDYPDFADFIKPVQEVISLDGKA